MTNDKPSPTPHTCLPNRSPGPHQPLTNHSPTTHQLLTNYSRTAQGERFVSSAVSPTHCHKTTSKFASHQSSSEVSASPPASTSPRTKHRAKTHQELTGEPQTLTNPSPNSLLFSSPLTPSPQPLATTLDTSITAVTPSLVPKINCDSLLTVYPPHQTNNLSKCCLRTRGSHTP